MKPYTFVRHSILMFGQPCAITVSWKLLELTFPSCSSIMINLFDHNTVEKHVSNFYRGDVIKYRLMSFSMYKYYVYIDTVYYMPWYINTYIIFLHFFPRSFFSKLINAIKRLILVFLIGEKLLCLIYIILFRNTKT